MPARAVSSIICQFKNASSLFCCVIWKNLNHAIVPLKTYIWAASRNNNQPSPSTVRSHKTNTQIRRLMCTLFTIFRRWWWCWWCVATFIIVISAAAAAAKINLRHFSIKSFKIICKYNKTFEHPTVVQSATQYKYINQLVQYFLWFTPGFVSLTYFQKINIQLKVCLFFKYTQKENYL